MGDFPRRVPRGIVYRINWSSVSQSIPMQVSQSRPRIIPVMDIRGGIVVRAIAGRREAYKPLVSRLTDSTDPVEVAEALRRVSESYQVYLADLDAIAGAPPNFQLFQALAGRGFHVWADAGIRTDDDVEALYKS